MKLLVLREMSSFHSCWECRIIEGPNEFQTVNQTVLVDLQTDGGLTKEEYKTLADKTVEVDYTYPFILIAMRVRIINKDEVAHAR